MANPVYSTGEKILKAYVAIKAGELKQGVTLFAEAVKADDGVDPIMDGIANAMKRIKAEDEEASEEDELDLDDEDDEEDVDDEDEGIDDDDDDDVDDDDEDEDDDDEESEVEVPASVARILRLR